MNNRFLLKATYQATAVYHTTLAAAYSLCKVSNLAESNRQLISSVATESIVRTAKISAPI